MKKMVKETLKMGGEEPKRGQGRQNKVIKDVGRRDQDHRLERSTSLSETYPRRPNGLLLLSTSERRPYIENKKSQRQLRP